MLSDTDSFICCTILAPHSAAVVVTDLELSDDAQLLIAKEMNLSETVYLRREAEGVPRFGIRWSVSMHHLCHSTAL